MNSKNSKSNGTALVTGASSGIGAVYADRLARRGHDLILVARNQGRLDSLAKRLTDDTRRSVKVIAADLNEREGLALVEQVLCTDDSITMLVNNAGVGAPTTFLDNDVERLDRMITLNVTALVHLTRAVVPEFVQRGGGTIINVASVAGIVPEVLNGVYGASKAFVIALSRSLHHEFVERGIRIQAVLPGATATEFWERSSTPLGNLPVNIVMKAEKMVDAAMAGFDQGELITIPSLPDIADWDAYEAARQRLRPNLSLSSPALRYARHGVVAHGK